MYPYIKQKIYIHTSVYSIPDLWSQRIIFHYWNGFCKAQISSHPEEATYSDLFSCSMPSPDLLQNDAQIVWLAHIVSVATISQAFEFYLSLLQPPDQHSKNNDGTNNGALPGEWLKWLIILSRSENVFHKLLKKKKPPLCGCIMKALHLTAFVSPYSTQTTGLEKKLCVTTLSSPVWPPAPLPEEWDLQEPRGSSLKSPLDFCLELEGFVGRGRSEGGSGEWGRTGDCFVLIRRDGGKNYKR